MKSAKSIIRVLLVFIGLFVFSNIKSQTADITKGCSPLEVNFKSSELSKYYWEFVEGNATSTLQNPVHIFTHPGEYNVTLLEGKGGNKIGEIKIKVYEDPIINFEADTILGCTPFTVKFISDISLDPDIKIQSYFWAFGDGATSSEQNPTHIYKAVGEFKVSLEIITDIVQCNEIYSIDKFIKTNQSYINFSSNTNSICDSSGKIIFKNNSTFRQNYIYNWDFGNGKTSSEYNPDSVFYDKPGVYTIALKITTNEGCIYLKEKKITIGKPIFDLVIPEIECTGSSFSVKNNTLVDSFLWSFNPSPSSYITKQRKVINGDTTITHNLWVSYDKGGTKTINLRAYAKNGCYSDTTFTISIENKPNVLFTIDPEEGCNEQSKIFFKASDTTFAKYNWSCNLTDSFNMKNKFTGSAIYNFKYFDSLRYKFPRQLIIFLNIETKNGCEASYEKYFLHSSPNAFFAPDIAQGCAPLTVTFSDSSESKYPIIEWKYIFSTGDSIVSDTNIDQSYTFIDPGDYYVKLIVETERGCIDTSAGEWIRVGEPISSDYEVDKTEICLGDTIKFSFKNNDPRIDAVHVFTDDGRYSHCWKNKNPGHVFNTSPGEYPVIAITEYNGCYVSDTADYKIKVNGAKSDLGYSMDCSHPNTVQFIDRSINADNLIWTIEGDTIIDDTLFTKYFDTTGVYSVKLEAFDNESGCTHTFDSTTFKITNVKASFVMPDKVCENIKIPLDASKSVDAADGCMLGYSWVFETYPTPLRTRYDSINIAFPRGNNLVKLIVEDENGCKDTMSRSLKAYGIDLDISIDKEAICLPGTIKVTNNSTSDTTLFWKWQNGSTEKEPVFTFEKEQNLEFKSIWVKVKDALGCETEPFITEVDIYKPKSTISINPGKSICIGDKLNFSATEYTEFGTELNYKWILEGLDSFDQRINSIVIDSAGTYPLNFYFTDINSGCSGDTSTTIKVYNIPKANFVSDADSLSPLCYPQIITFNDSSTIYGPGYVRWLFKDVTLSNNNNEKQVIEFPKGKHEATLIARSYYGCSDTITKQFEIVGPEGDVITDKFSVCTGDTIKFELINTVDVNSFKWDFGDGITIADQNPISHVFNRVIDTTDAKIVIKSTDNCEISIDIPLLVDEVIADFEEMDTSLFCTGQTLLNNLSIGANKFDWITDGEINDDTEPIFIKYPSAGKYNITLKAFNTFNECKDEITKTINLEEFKSEYIIPNLFTPNGDGENDTFGPVITNNDFKGIYKFISFKVYNRWGNLVYNNENPDVGWNGKFNGLDAPAGVYGYFLKVNVNNCKLITRKGNITLMR